MKQFCIITILLCLFLSSFTCHGSDGHSVNRKRIPVIVTVTRKTSPVQRNDFVDVSVYLCPYEEIIEIEGTGIRQADVFITDIERNDIDSLFVETLDLIQMSMPTVAGTYMIILSSPELYAEGIFTIN